MPKSRRTGTGRVDLEVSIEAKLRFDTLHKAFGFKSKSETFEAILYHVSTVDKIDPAVMERIERKLDRVTELIDDLL